MIIIKPDICRVFECNSYSFEKQYEVKKMLLNEIRMPVQKRSLERFNQVIDTAIFLLETQDFRACTILEISNISQVPRNHIYQYFPTINHLFIIIVRNYFYKLMDIVQFGHPKYLDWEVMDILREVVGKSCKFYNENRPASLLILGGPIDVDGFNLQEEVIQIISKNLAEVFTSKKNPIVLNNENDINYLIELIFAIMKHSYYKYQKITEDLEKEALFVAEAYLFKKGYI